MITGCVQNAWRGVGELIPKEGKNSPLFGIEYQKIILE